MLVEFKLFNREECDMEFRTFKSGKLYTIRFLKNSTDIFIHVYTDDDPEGFGVSDEKYIRSLRSNTLSELIDDVKAYVKK